MRPRIHAIRGGRCLAPVVPRVTCMNQPDADPLEIASPVESPGRGRLVPRRCTLDGFVLELGCTRGVALQSLNAGTVLTVSTRNTRYEVIILDPATRQVVVSGGPAFPERSRVRLEGTTTGGSALRVGWIGVGLRMEMSTRDRRVTTSRVRSITIQSVPPLPSQSVPGSWM